MLELNHFYNMDCMEGMKEFPDKYFELAIVDPPYGINMDGGKIGGDNKGKATNYIKKHGILQHQKTNILMSYCEYQKIKLFLEQTISYHEFLSIALAG